MGKGGGGCSMETLILMHFLIFLQFVPDDLNLSRGMIYVTQCWKLRQVCVRTKRGTQVLALLKRSHRDRRMREFALWWWAGHHFDGYTVFFAATEDSVTSANGLVDFAVKKDSLLARTKPLDIIFTKTVIFATTRDNLLADTTVGYYFLEHWALPQQKITHWLW